MPARRAPEQEVVPTSTMKQLCRLPRADSNFLDQKKGTQTCTLACTTINNKRLLHSANTAKHCNQHLVKASLLPQVCCRTWTYGA